MGLLTSRKWIILLWGFGKELQ